MNTKRLVITGGPGTGKTMLIKALENEGYYCFHEVIRAMTLKLKDDSENTEAMVNPIAFTDDAKTFNDNLLYARLKHFNEAKDIDSTQVFYDRGMPDVLAYMDYFKQEYGTDYSALCKDNLYDLVLILPPWKAIYVQDNERMENFEQATAIHQHLKNTYTSLGYTTLEVPFGTVEERLTFVKNLIN